QEYKDVAAELQKNADNKELGARAEHLKNRIDNVIPAEVQAGLWNDFRKKLREIILPEAFDRLNRAVTAYLILGLLEEYRETQTRLSDKQGNKELQNRAASLRDRIREQAARDEEGNLPDFIENVLSIKTVRASRIEDLDLLIGEGRLDLAGIDELRDRISLPEEYEYDPDKPAGSVISLLAASDPELFSKKSQSANTLEKLLQYIWKKSAQNTRDQLFETAYMAGLMALRKGYTPKEVRTLMLGALLQGYQKEIAALHIGKIKAGEELAPQLAAIFKILNVSSEELVALHMKSPVLKNWGKDINEFLNGKQVNRSRMEELYDVFLLAGKTGHYAVHGPEKVLVEFAGDELRLLQDTSDLLTFLGGSGRQADQFAEIYGSEFRETIRELKKDIDFLKNEKNPLRERYERAKTVRERLNQSQKEHVLPRKYWDNFKTNVMLLVAETEKNLHAPLQLDDVFVHMSENGISGKAGQLESAADAVWASAKEAVADLSADWKAPDKGYFSLSADNKRLILSHVLKNHPDIAGKLLTEYAMSNVESEVSEELEKEPAAGRILDRKNLFRFILGTFFMGTGGIIAASLIGTFGIAGLAGIIIITLGLGAVMIL
ncbi:MAG TPA: hypothetical protein VJC03_06705, partial [bacterium]|nr:hypothetical protein [bacterium]